MKKISIWIGVILISYISIVYAQPIDPYILEYRIDSEFDKQQESKSLDGKGKNFYLNIQPVSSDDWRIKIDLKDGLEDKINVEFHGNLDSKGHILEAQAKLKIKKEKFILSTEVAHQNLTPLMKESLFGKVSFNFLPSSMFGFINYEGKINIGWLHLPSLYSRYSSGREGTDMFGGGVKWHLYTKPYEITPDFLFKSELKLVVYSFTEFSRKNYDKDENIKWVFYDFPVAYSLNFTKRVSQRCNIEMDYQGNINPSFYPWGVAQIPLSHGVVSKVNLRATDALLFQLAAYLPLSNKKISYFNPNASFISKEILTNLEFKEKNGWNFKSLFDYDYENNQFEEVTFSASRRFNSLNGGVYYTNNRRDSSQHTIGIYLSNSGETDYSRYNLKSYQGFPQNLSPKKQNEDMKWLNGKDFGETVSALNTPEKVASYLNQFFQYHSNGALIPQTPRETFEKKMGDCDDQARFASYVLTQHGYEAYVLTYYARRVAHGISVYKAHNGKWNTIEYDNIFYAHADNPEELITKIEPGILKYTLFNPDDNYEVKSYLASQTLEKIINWFWAD